MSHKIGIIGTKNVGKTSLATRLVSELRVRGHAVGYVAELAEYAPVSINARTDNSSALWLIGSQIAEEALRYGKCEYLVCDRTVYDVLVFYRLSACQETEYTDAWENLSDLVRAYITMCPYHFLFFIKADETYWSSSVTNEEIAFRRSIEAEFTMLVSDDIVSRSGTLVSVLSGSGTDEYVSEIVRLVESIRKS